MGELVGGKYELSDVIGKGKFGLVMKATDTTSKLFAVKFSDSELCIIRHEAMILNYLNSKKCKNVPLVHWYGIFSGIPCIVISHYNYSLSNATSSNTVLIDQMLTIIKNVHDLFVTHRDIKPENFMVNHKNEVVLIDFGLATFCLEDEIKDKNNDTTVFTEQSEAKRSKTTFTGNILFASPNIHSLKKARKIDDVISIAYIYIYLYFKSDLPWIKLKDDEFKLEKIFNLKKIENIESFMDKATPNIEIVKIMSFVRRLYNGILTYSV